MTDAVETVDVAATARIPAAAAQTHGLGWPGRIAIGVVIVAGMVVGAPSVLGLFWFIPFAGVGALLAIRRPRTSIGWILLLLGWAHVLSVFVPFNATVGQFTDGSLSVPMRVLAWVLGWSSLSLFLLYTVLMLVFPSGRLPRSRWGSLGRVGIGIGILLVAVSAFAPTININLPGYPNGADVRNPFAILPNLGIWQVLNQDVRFVPALALMVAAAVSLVVRFRRATGIERQQLRWIGASVAVLVLAVVGGLVVGRLVPSLEASGAVWVPALLAFPTVPVAIGIAVMRYRLYEIDTIINRAIVYGLLTAILAGASSALIGIGERLFQGVVGPGSDASIILTTLVVVTAFTPIKDRLQRFVDRRFKEVRDPAIALEAFVDEVRRSLSRPDRDRTLGRLLQVAVDSYGAGGGELYIGPAGSGKPIAVGTTSSSPTMSVAVTTGGLEVAIALSGSDPSRDPEPLRNAIADAIAELPG